MTKKINKVERIALMGGLIGELFTNPRKALEKALTRANDEGWNCRQILTHTTTNLFIKGLIVLCLVCTFGFWTFGAGYLLLLEKEDK